MSKLTWCCGEEGGGEGGGAHPSQGCRARLSQRIRISQVWLLAVACLPKLLVGK